MPLSARITFRLTPALAALVADHVRQGRQVSDIVREALEAYFGLPQTSGAAVSDQASASVADTVSALATQVSDVVAAVSDMQARLAQLEAQREGRSPRVRQRPTPRPTPAPPVGLKQCRYHHPPYPLSKAECPGCVRVRAQRYRARKAL